MGGGWGAGSLPSELKRSCLRLLGPEGLCLPEALIAAVALDTAGAGRSHRDSGGGMEASSAIPWTGNVLP